MAAKTKELKTKTIDLTCVKAPDLDGKELTFNIAKDLGNYIYRTTPDLGALELAQTIYKTGKIELTDQHKKELKEIINAPDFPFIALVKKTILEAIKK